MEKREVQKEKLTGPSHRERVIDHKEGLRLHLLLPSESQEEEKDQARVKIRSHGELGRRKKTVGL